MFCGRIPTGFAGTRDLALSALLLLLPGAVPGQTPRAGPPQPIPSIEEKTAGMRKIDGFFPLYWDAARGQLWMEIARWETEVLHVTGLAAGLGSNDIGLDRGQLAGSRIVRFERVGPKVLMVQPNYGFRASSANPAEVRAVRDAFARSIVWGFTAAAETGSRALVDLTEFLVSDTNISQRLRPGNYRFDPSRSSIFLPMTQGFPKNTEMEAELTFVRQPGGGGPGGGPSAGAGRFFEGVSDVAATGEAATLRLHHSLVELPDSNYRPRRFDPRSGYGVHSFQDYAVPIEEPLTQRFIRRHRLEDSNPGAPAGIPVKPIVYYLDPGAPEPLRSALLDGARWWNQAFEAAGYRDAFRVELLPEGVSPLDVRYNVINWVHRSTRGWSTGATVTDPRTGEIIKGVVTLGSLRVRQDYLIAEGLLSPYRNGDETPPELRRWALARIRQLSAHEVGHTLGLGHNYYDSREGRISVMDYPHPLLSLNADGTLDHSRVYAEGIGEWDKVAISYGYRQIPQGMDEAVELAKILDDAWSRDLLYMTNQDTSANPKVDQWSNGTDPAAELNRMMGIRRAALERFGENAIRGGQPMATMEEVLVPLYLHHRYQVEAAASALGGLHYIYASRGDGREPFRRVPASEQHASLEALLSTLRPAELKLPPAVVNKLPPRPSGYWMTRELFPRTTGPVFDLIAPAVTAADLTVSNILDGDRAARMVQQQAVDPALPGLDEVIERLVRSVFDARTADAYEAEIKRAVERVVVENLMTLAGGASSPQVRAVASDRLALMARDFSAVQGPGPDGAHQRVMAADIRRFLERPYPPAQRAPAPAIPPGAPIGEPAITWIPRVEPACSWGPEEPR